MTEKRLDEEAGISTAKHGAFNNEATIGEQ
jgi:hypothetical protein